MNNAKERSEEMEIDLGKLFRFYLKNWLAILASGLVVAFAALLFTFFLVTPMYRSTVTVYVNNTKNVQTDAVTGSNLSAAIHLVKSYVNIIESKPVLEEVIRVGGFDYTVDAMRQMISAEQIGDTEMFRVKVAHPDADMAAKIANTIADVAPARIAHIVEGSSAKIVEYADLAKAPYTPNFKKNLLLGGLLGCILMGGLLTLRYLFDMRLQDEEDMALYFDAPVLGMIPDFNQESRKKHRGYGYDSQSGSREGGTNA